MKPVTGGRFCRVLERHGWQRVKTKSGHRKYRRGVATLIVPVHGNKLLKTGLQAALMKQAGLADADL